MVAVDDLEGVELAGGAVEDLVDGATAAAADSVEAIEVGEVEGGRRSGGQKLGRGGGGGGGGGGGEGEGYG